MIRIIIILILLCSNAKAQDIITNLTDSSSTSILNEELRKARGNTRQNSYDIATVIDNVTTINAKFPVSISNGGTGKTTAQEAIDEITQASTGVSGQVWTLIGSNGGWSDNTNMPVYVADDSTFASSDVEKSFGDLSYTKQKEITLYGSGSAKVYFELKADGSSTATAKIYKNGSAIGSERTTTSTTYVGYAEILTGLVNGDKIQIYGYRTSGSNGLVQNFRIKGTQSTINLE